MLRKRKGRGRLGYRDHRFPFPNNEGEKLKKDRKRIEENIEGISRRMNSIECEVEEEERRMRLNALIFAVDDFGTEHGK